MDLVSERPIELGTLLASAHHPRAGGLVLFCGEVRNHTEGRQVLYLEYEAHVPMATKIISRLLDEAKARWKLEVALCQHRLGRLQIGETAVAIVTAAAHREAAYAANRFIIDTVKRDVPIWKREVFADGSSAWGCHHRTVEASGVRVP